MVKYSFSIGIGVQKWEDDIVHLEPVRFVVDVEKSVQESKTWKMKAVTSKIHGYIKPAAGILTVVIAVTTTLNVAAAKYTAASTSYTLKSFLLISRIVGPQVAGQMYTSMFPTQPAPTWFPAAGIVPFGPFNQTTFGAIAILVINNVIKSFNVPYYNSYAAPFINALGIGTLVGGVVGGLLDPDPATQGTPGASNFLSVNPIMPLNPSSARPFLSATALRLHGVR